MSKLKVVTVVGTRPEIIRLSRVIPKLDQFCDHVLVHTGQNYDYELNQIFFDDLELRQPDVYLNAAGSTSAETIGKIIIEADKILEAVRPDALLVLGDTNSCLSVLPAKRRKIPVFHMEAGNRCFDQRVPEEINRRIVDHIADINLTYSSIARQYLLSEGIAPDLVIKTGSPLFEVLAHYQSGILSSSILERLRLDEKRYFLVSAHREENLDNRANYERLIQLLNHVASQYDLPVIVSTHPRTRKRIEHEGTQLHRNIRLLKPLGFKDYCRLQIAAKVTLSDSGTITEESSILKFPALNIREAHERPEGMEEGAVMLVGLNIDRVVAAIGVLESPDFLSDRDVRIVADYSVPNVSEKILRLIYSYTDYVRRVIWKEY